MRSSRTMRERESVICGAHGETAATFTCRHVASGVACGFHASAEDPDDPWPDAWCDLCAEALQAAGGEWSDVPAEQVQIQRRCARCYEAARERNRDVPLHARGAAARLTELEVSQLIRHAVRASQGTQAASKKRWGWGDMARWQLDDAAATLTFSDPTKPTVVADVQIVGSYSARSGTFQWAWQTLGTADPKTDAVSRLRVFGEVRGLAMLATPNWPCEETDGWAMASLAGYVSGGEGLYRAAFDQVYWYLLLTGWRIEA